MAKLLFPLAAALAAASLALPAMAQPEVTPLDVTKAPTTITVSIAGKDKAAVRKDVKVAAGTVCRNAVTNREVAFYDLTWCSQRASNKAMVQYAAIVRHTTFADSGVITLAVR
jgi:hypothetical protein